MNTATLTKKALKDAELYLQDLGLQKVFSNKTIDSTSIITDARTGTVEIEQLYRKEFKIKKQSYVASIELSLAISGLEDGQVSFVCAFDSQLVRYDEDDALGLDVNSALDEIPDDNAKVIAFINNLPKFKPKSLDEVKF